VIDYFSAALMELARLALAGNDQHNPGESLHWARDKSTDHADALGRHLIDRGLRDADWQRHSAKLAWRALALLQLELEAEGAPVARGATVPSGISDAAGTAEIEPAPDDLAGGLARVVPAMADSQKICGTCEHLRLAEDLTSADFCPVRHSCSIGDPDASADLWERRIAWDRAPRPTPTVRPSGGESRYAPHPQDQGHGNER
jgi:hypothetical protein